MSKKSKSETYLDDPEIKRWHDNVARGALTTADIYLRRLIAVCEARNTTPEALAKMNENDLYTWLLDFVTLESGRGMTGSYVETSVKSVKSWLAYNRINIPGKIKIKDARKAPTLENERVPTQDELRQIFLASTSRDRVSCVLVAHSGVRLEVLGNYKGTDGLLIRDFPEMKIADGVVSFEKVPTLVMVRSELSKAGHKYFTFLSEEGSDYLKGYMEDRIRNGETLDSESDVIKAKIASKKFIRSINIGDGIRTSIRAAGFKWRPYILRSFFNTQLLLAESKGKIPHAYRQFFLGHKGDIEGRYTTNIGILPPDLIEDMRDSYKKSQVFLQTIQTEDEDKKLAEFRTQILRMTGVSQEEINEMDLESMADQDIMDILKKKMMKTMTENGNRNKVIPLDQVEEYIQNGWEYVNNLPNNPGDHEATVYLKCIPDSLVFPTTFL